MVMSHESGWSSSCQKVNLKSILKNICAFLNFVFVSPCLGFGKLNNLMALLIFLASKVILSEPSGFGETIEFDIQGAGSEIGFSSIILFFIMSSMILWTCFLQVAQISSLWLNNWLDACIDVELYLVCLKLVKAFKVVRILA